MKNTTYKFGLKMIDAQKKELIERAKNEAQTAEVKGWWIKEHATKIFIKNFEAGKITEKELREHVEARRVKSIEKDAAAKIQELEAMKNAPEITSISISVEWKNSRTWGANPTAYVNLDGPGVHDYEESRSVTGCGYDKRSAATAEALNKNLSFKALLLELHRQAIEEKNTNFYGYHVFYLPYLEGGCGFSCHQHIIEAMGFKSLVLDERSKNYDRYEFRK